jgi:hypothetical protein
MEDQIVVFLPYNAGTRKKVINLAHGVKIVRQEGTDLAKTVWRIWNKRK